MSGNRVLGRPRVLSQPGLELWQSCCQQTQLASPVCICGLPVELAVAGGHHVHPTALFAAVLGVRATDATQSGIEPPGRRCMHAHESGGGASRGQAHLCISLFDSNPRGAAAPEQAACTRASCFWLHARVAGMRDDAPARHTHTRWRGPNLPFLFAVPLRACRRRRADVGVQTSAHSHASLLWHRQVPPHVCTGLAGSGSDARGPVSNNRPAARVIRSPALPHRLLVGRCMMKLLLLLENVAAPVRRTLGGCESHSA
jgi:hypothetical protein